MKQSNSINSIQKSDNLNTNKFNKFLENTKQSVKKALTATGIAASTMGPMATTTTSTVVPASVNTITAVAPLTSASVKTISLGTAASLLTACGGGEDDGPDGPINPIDTKDTIAPTINVSKSEIDITGGKQIRIEGNQLYIGDILVVSRNDNKSKTCNVELSLNGKTITSGTTISEEGTLTIKVSDEANNNKSTDIKLNITKNAPSITVNQYEINIFGGTTVNISNNQLLLGDEVIASRNDNNLESCKVTLNFNGQEIKSGESINESGTLTITVINKNDKTSTAEITLKNEAIYGLENLKNATIQVDKEINLLNGITFADGVELVKTEVKTEVEADGSRNIIPDPNHYTPAYPGSMNIIFTVKGKNGNTAEIKVDNLTIKPLEYKTIGITNIKPVELLPIIGQIEVGDDKCYEHIEHLRIAEATRIRDMMREYGAGNHNAEKYQQLMMRLNTGMMGENPIGYNNYEAVGGTPIEAPSNHAHKERSILNTLINHANFKVINPPHYNFRSELYNLAKENPNKINIIGVSVDSNVDKIQYDSREMEKHKEHLKEKNLILFGAGSNITEKNGHLLKKIYQENYNLPDVYSTYTSMSAAHEKNDKSLDIHIMITIGTNMDGYTDITNETNEASKFPVGFHNKVLFAGRTFPYYTSDNKCYTESYGGNYATSYTNYVNIAMADLCFQMFAEAKDVDQLLEMIRSTALTDYIKLNNQIQTLQLINPAGFFKKYLMPTDIPTNIKSDQNITLNKGYYKGVIFDIPGAEVKINGQWVAYNDTNKSLIKNQNPMTLEWRINGDLCKKMGYNNGKNIKGKITVVDDKWNGLNIDKDFSISVQ